MTKKLIPAAVAAALFAAPALAETPAETAPPMPEASAPSAETGAAVDTAATAADLKTGARVSDMTGAEVGLVTQVTAGEGDAGAMVTLSADGKTRQIPAASITKKDGALVTSHSKADVWAEAE